MPDRGVLGGTVLFLALTASQAELACTSRKAVRCCLHAGGVDTLGICAAAALEESPGLSLESSACV